MRFYRPVKASQPLVGQHEVQVRPHIPDRQMLILTSEDPLPVIGKRIAKLKTTYDLAKLYSQRSKLM